MIPGVVAGVVAVSSGGGEEYEGPLDIVSGAVVAYGQRALSAARLGQPLYTIRENGGDTTQTFNADAETGDAPVAAISTFLNGADGFVTSWKDQSGNSKDTFEADSAKQPAWLANGIGGKPAVVFTRSANQQLVSTADVSLPVGQYTWFAVFDVTDDGLHLMFGCSSPDFTPLLWYVSAGGDSQAGLSILMDTFDGTNGAEQVTDYLTGLLNTPLLCDAWWQTGSGSLYINGVSTPTDTVDDGGALSPITAKFSLGQAFPDDGFSEGLDGKLVELIVYNSILSDPQRLAIRQNIATYYGVTLP